MKNIRRALVSFIWLSAAGYLSIPVAFGAPLKTPLLIMQPDLTVSVKAPRSAAAGSDIGNKITVRVKNRGKTVARGTNSADDNGYMVDVMLSSDRSTPAGWARYSANYHEDVLLRGGRISRTADLGRGKTKRYRTGGGIPADTPTGKYYICAKVDSGNKIAESKEGNNVDCSAIRIKGAVTTAPTTPGAGVATEVPIGTITGIFPAVPVQLAPSDGKLFRHYPRKVSLRWKRVAGATYDVEVDCLHCRVSGQWDSDSGGPWKTASGIRSTRYRFTFVGDNQGRWRVRAVKGDLKSSWSPWWHFSFRTKPAAGAEPAGAGSETPAMPAGPFLPPGGLVAARPLKEDCVSFNPDTTEVKKINGRWKIVDGKHWMFDFAEKQAEARQALRIIKHYGFTKSCFVGRPDPSFQYLRR